MENFDAMVNTIENSTDYDARHDAVIGAVGWLFKAYGEPGPKWDTPEGERLRPLWDDFNADMDVRVCAELAELERVLLTRDYPDDPWSAGDPFV